MKKSYKGFPVYLFIVLGVMMTAQMFTSMMNPQRGSRIKYSEMLSYIEQGVTNVSGGQKQRLCIARALLRKPKILSLDDSTSAVDTKTDALIRRAFAEEIPETTKIIIAQRVASVEKADKILVLDGGKIVAMGNHEELMKTSEIYREVYETPTKSRSVSADEDADENADVQSETDEKKTEGGDAE